MRITVNIDDPLLANLMEITGEKTKTKAVNLALKEYVRRKHVQELFDYWRDNPMSDDEYRERLENKKKQLEAEERRHAFLDSLRYGTS